MIPVAIEFRTSPLKEFRITKLTGNANIRDLIDKLRLNSLVEEANKHSKYFSFTIVFNNGEILTNCVKTDARNFYFTILCWAWKIDRGLENDDNLITFDFDFDKFDHNKRFEVDKFLNLAKTQSCIINNHLYFFKVKICEHLLRIINLNLQHKKVRLYRFKLSFDGNKLIIERESNAIMKWLMSIGFILFLFASCTSQSKDCVSKTIQSPWGGTTIGYDNIVLGCENGWFDN